MKALVTGIAAAAAVTGAAAGITPIAMSVSAAPAITPVVWGVPMPAAPAPELNAPLLQTLNGLAAGGSFSSKQSYIEGGLGRFETRGADAKYAQKAAEGVFPLSFVLADIDQNGASATANVTVTAANGATGSAPVSFVQGPSPTGWQISKASALNLLSSAG